MLGGMSVFVRASFTMLIWVRRRTHCGQHQSLGWRLTCIRVEKVSLALMPTHPGIHCSVSGLWIQCDQLLQL